MMNESERDTVSFPGSSTVGLVSIPAMRDADAHVWSMKLCCEPSLITTLTGILSPDERQRAERFVFERDRSRFIQARGLLRVILGSYLRMPADQVRFHYDEFGKPLLDVTIDGDRFGFNVAHSHGLALYVVARNQRVGIDVEYVNAKLAHLDIAEQCFSPSEMEELRRVPHDLEPIAFFNGWTRKEAYIKALGKGLSYHLREFSVPLTSVAPGTMLDVHDPHECHRWSLISLPAPAGFVAALVTEEECSMVYLRWSGDTPDVQGWPRGPEQPFSPTLGAADRKQSTMTLCRYPDIVYVRGGTVYR